MYYIGISETDGNKMIYYCRNCGNKDETVTNEGICVLNTQLKRGGQQFHHIINQYTKLDPTLPRLYHITCPNMSCKTNDTKTSSKETSGTEVIYLRYDDENMKYVYICVECDTIWKTDDNK
jgi:DNA-directed RNA polymerase subunit M/transcription elongation factor TFIIS